MAGNKNIEESGWNGRGILITGASRGLGLALSRAFADQGARVAGVARGRSELLDAYGPLISQGHELFPIVADVGEINEARSIAAEAHAALGQIDVLIHNASTLGPTPLPHLLDLDLDAAQRVVEVNLLGPLALTQAVAGTMAARGHGKIVFISSDAAVEGYPGWGIYGATKAAADHLGRVLAAELNGTEVSVLSVDPGEMDTAMHAAAMPDADPRTLQKPDEVARRLVLEIFNTTRPGFARRAA
jgi:NAD(P)-dependent dehydrogenase (short-subunit alcohol dehydrogenase family)